MIYDPQNWYWFVGGDTTQVYSSAAGAFVSAADAAYQSWLAAGGEPTHIDSAASLGGVLSKTNAPRPVDAAVLDGYQTAAASAVDIAIGRILFNHENRLRALEGLAPVTAQQFVAAIKTIL